MAVKVTSVSKKKDNIEYQIIFLLKVLYLLLKRSLRKANNRMTLLTMMSKSIIDCGSIALRTLPVYLKSGNRKLKVNALLDDASTKTYVNADVAAELGLQGHPQRVNVSVLNGAVETFETTPIDCFVESLDG